MRRLFGIIFKLLPIITIWQGVSSGGARLGPFMDTFLVALTQYEVAQITRLVIEDYAGNKGKLMAPQEFPDFVKDMYHSQYSVLARQIMGEENHQQNMDIWGKHFHLIINPDATMVKVASAGPDGVISNKDDIVADFTIERATPRKGLAAAPSKAEMGPTEAPEQHESTEYDIAARVPAEDNRYQDADFDGEGYNREGFDKDGYDRDGFDQNGIHYNEKEMHQAYY
jgi:hypothetical protein